MFGADASEATAVREALDRGGAWLNRQSLGVHQAAAGVIARRGQGFIEVAPVSGTQRVSVAGMVVEWLVPVEISRNNMSQRWSLLHKELRRAIASHYSARKTAERASRPLQAASPIQHGAELFGSHCESVVPGGIPGTE